ncbi:MAG: cyclic nucleotide-binding domain-containing protein [Elusimicrobiota bacterium]
MKSLFESFFLSKEFKQKVEFLSRVPVFDGLSRRALGRIVPVLYEKTYPAGETVFKEGEPGRALFIIKSGEVVIAKSRMNPCDYGGVVANPIGNPPGVGIAAAKKPPAGFVAAGSVPDDKVLSTITAGNFFGEMALLEEMSRSATAKTTKDSVLCFMYKINMDNIIQKDPRIGIIVIRNLAKIVSSRLRQTSEFFAGLT